MFFDNNEHRMWLTAIGSFNSPKLSITSEDGIDDLEYTPDLTPFLSQDEDWFDSISGVCDGGSLAFTDQFYCDDPDRLSINSFPSIGHSFSGDWVVTDGTVRPLRGGDGSWRYSFPRNRESSIYDRYFSTCWCGVSDDASNLVIICDIKLVMDGGPSYGSHHKFGLIKGHHDHNRCDETTLLEYSGEMGYFGAASTLIDLFHQSPAEMRIVFPSAIIAEGFLCPGNLGLDLLLEKGADNFSLVARYVSCFSLSPVRWSAGGVFAVNDLRGALLLLEVWRPDK